MTARATRRVLMLLENNPYPQDRRVLAEASALTDAGYHVSVIAPAAPAQPWHEVVDGVSVYRYPAPPTVGGVLGYVWEYGYSLAAASLISMAVFLRHGFDVLHAHNPPDMYVFVAAFYKLFGVRFVFDHHDLSPEMYCARFGASSSGLIYHVLVWLERLSCRLADRVIATNQSYKAIEMKRGPVPPDRITVVRNGPDLTRTYPVEPDPDLRSSGKTVIGYVGVMGFQDGVDYLLRALRHLACDLGRRDFFCVLIGKGDAWASLKALATQLGLDQHVWFTGRVSESDLRRYLCAADICVDPDPSNPFNDRSSMIKMSEYMAFAKPIVAFDLPEHRVTAQDAAQYVAPNDEAAFALALAELMDDPGRRQAMGASGRRRAETALAWPFSVPFLLEAYGALFPDPVVVRSRPSRETWAPFGLRLRQRMWWLRQRSAGYIALRSLALTKRYGVTSPRAKRRVLACVTQLAGHGCHPTFPIPGWIVRKYSEFSRTLQGMGAELAIHGYHHVDFRSLSLAEAGQQFARAAAAFQESGIQADGYRCPYLSATEELPRALPDGLINYSSNRAIWWDDVVPARRAATAIFENLRRFYRAESSRAVVAMPRTSNGLIEIPVSLPDDLQLSDGFNLDAEGIQRAWTEVLHQVHQRGELFVVLFHPESYEHCERAFEHVLSKAGRMRPAVWVTQLRDVSRWWQEKAGFAVDVCAGRSGGLRLRFTCTDRATVLVRGLDTADTERWYGSYRVLNGRSLDVAPDTYPFVGVAPEVPDRVTSFLEEQGYLLERGVMARRCGVYLDTDAAKRFETEVQLVDHIESSPAPLVRFWRWPHEFRSALCVTGDIDALSLADYVARLFAMIVLLIAPA